MFISVCLFPVACDCTSVPSEGGVISGSNVLVRVRNSLQQLGRIGNTHTYTQMKYTPCPFPEDEHLSSPDSAIGTAPLTSML